MSGIDILLANNRRWVADMTAKDPAFFQQAGRGPETTLPVHWLLRFAGARY
jgi:carbonic anhydrase